MIIQISEKRKKTEINKTRDEKLTTVTNEIQIHHGDVSQKHILHSSGNSKRYKQFKIVFDPPKLNQDQINRPITND